MILQEKITQQLIDNIPEMDFVDRMLLNEAFVDQLDALLKVMKENPEYELTNEDRLLLTFYERII